MITELQLETLKNKIKSEGQIDITTAVFWLACEFDLSGQISGSDLSGVVFGAGFTFNGTIFSYSEVIENGSL